MEPTSLASSPPALRRTSLRIESLKLVSEFRSRLDPDHVRGLASADRDLPPILVSWPDLTVIDGLHRVHAARLQGRVHIECDLFEGSTIEGYAAFVERNSTHGLPLTLNERRAAARRILSEQPQLSDRRIAQICALSATVIARLRTTVPTREVNERVGRDGRGRPVDRFAMRQRIAEEIAADSSASLRQIAARAGASPETVRSVRRSTNAALELESPVPAEELQAPVVFARRSTSSSRRDWTTDSALSASTEALTFAEWFNSTSTEAGRLEFAFSVPLSRIYELAEEARRRAAFWTSFSQNLESRATQRRSVAS